MAFKTFAISPSNYKATVIKNVLNDKNCQLQSMSKINILDVCLQIFIVLDKSDIIIFKSVKFHNNIEIFIKTIFLQLLTKFVHNYE